MDRGKALDAGRRKLEAYQQEKALRALKLKEAAAQQQKPPAVQLQPTPATSPASTGRNTGVLQNGCKPAAWATLPLPPLAAPPRAGAPARTHPNGLVHAGPVSGPKPEQSPVGPLPLPLPPPSDGLLPSVAKEEPQGKVPLRKPGDADSLAGSNLEEEPPPAGGGMREANLVAEAADLQSPSLGAWNSRPHLTRAVDKETRGEQSSSSGPGSKAAQVTSHSLSFSSALSATSPPRASSLSIQSLSELPREEAALPASKIPPVLEGEASSAEAIVSGLSPGGLGDGEGEGSDQQAAAEEPGASRPEAEPPSPEKQEEPLQPCVLGGGTQVEEESEHSAAASEGKRAGCVESPGEGRSRTPAGELRAVSQEVAEESHRPSSSREEPSPPSSPVYVSSYADLSDSYIAPRAPKPPPPKQRSPSLQRPSPTWERGSPLPTATHAQFSFGERSRGMLDEAPSRPSTSGRMPLWQAPPVKNGLPASSSSLGSQSTKGLQELGFGLLPPLTDGASASAGSRFAAYMAQETQTRQDARGSLFGAGRTPVQETAGQAGRPPDLLPNGPPSTNGHAFPAEDGPAPEPSPSVQGVGGPELPLGSGIPLGKPYSRNPSIPSSIAGLDAQREAAPKDFSALQQHIEELTEEKYEVQRGLEGQALALKTLAQENAQLFDDFNRQAGQVEALQREVARYQGEIAAQRMALGSTASERDYARAAAADANARLKEMAAESVALEDRVRHTRSAELLATRQLAEAREAARKAGSQVAAANADRDSMRATLQAMQEDRQQLHVRLRQAYASNPSSSPSPPLPGPPARESGTQTDPSLALMPAVVEDEQGLLVRAGGSRAGRELDMVGGVSRGIQGQEGGREMTVSSRLAEAAVLQVRTAALGEGRGHLSALPAALAHLLPARYFQGGLAGVASAHVDAERASLSSIHQLLGQLERRQHSLLAKLVAKEEDNAVLRKGSDLLQRKLQAAQQRLEMTAARQLLPPRALHPHRDPPQQLPPPRPSLPSPAPPQRGEGRGSVASRARQTQLLESSQPSPQTSLLLGLDTSPAPTSGNGGKDMKGRAKRRGPLTWLSELVVPSVRPLDLRQTFV